jgi:hypothetical protein
MMAALNVQAKRTIMAQRVIYQRRLRFKLGIVPHPPSGIQTISVVGQKSPILRYSKKTVAK